MKHIRPEAMTKEVRLLWETAEVRDLRPERIASFIGVGFKTVYNWFRGQRPFGVQRVKILEGVKKIEATYPDPFATNEVEIRKGVFVSKARWVKGPEPTESDEKYHAEIDRFFRELEAKVPAGREAEAILTDDAYLHFQNLVSLAQKYHVPLPKIK